jgi:hypothetical protein
VKFCMEIYHEIFFIVVSNYRHKSADFSMRTELYDFTNQLQVSATVL